MNRPLLFAALWLLAAGISNAAPDAGGVTLDPGEGRITDTDSFRISFPAAMAAAEDIDAGGKPPPFTSEPKLDGVFLWKSQTEGEFTVDGPVIPGAVYHFSLAPGLKDLSGNPVAIKEWSAEFKAEAFHIQPWEDQLSQKHLDALPRISVDTNYDVSFAEAAAHCYFQDKSAFKRFPAEVIQTERNDALLQGAHFAVQPREPLPPDRGYELVFNGLTDLRTRTPLPFPQVFPAGTTASLGLDWLGAFNAPLDRPMIRAHFDDAIDPDSVSPDAFHVEPAVRNLKIVANEDEIDAQGDFDTARRYTVTVSPALKGKRGYGLPAPSRWGATFRPKRPSVLFPPDEQILQRSAPGLRFSFIQVNTALLTWNLAEVPLEKLAAVTARVHEFTETAKDPLTGRTLKDPNTGLDKNKETELLVKAFDLKIVGSGRFDSTGADQEVLRTITYAPDGTPLSGPYLLEVCGYGADGRFVGNRTVVCFSEIMMTQKRSRDTVTLRLAKMSDGSPVANAPVRAVSADNYFLAQAESNNEGLAFFTTDRLFPKKGPQAHLYIADAPDGPAYQFVDAAPYASGRPGTKDKETVLRSFILTDRNLYRPGQTVKWKGFVRRAWGGDLITPADDKISWWITPEGSDAPAAEGSAPLKEGGWDAEWAVPEKTAIGSYVIHCKVGGLSAEEPRFFQVQEYRAPLFSVTVEPAKAVGPRSRVRVSSAYFHGAPNAGARIHWKAAWNVSRAEQSEEAFQREDLWSPKAPASFPEEEEMEGDAVLDVNGMAELQSDAPFADPSLFGRYEVNWRVDVTSVDGQTITGGTHAPLQRVPALPGVRCRAEDQASAVKVEVDAVTPENEPIGQFPVRADLYHVTSKTVKEQLARSVYRYRNTNLFEKVASKILRTKGAIVFAVRATGRYVATVTGAESATPIVSDETFVSGEQYAELPVEDESSFKLVPLDKKQFYTPGDVAAFSIQAPFGGTAWVTVETNEILDSLFERIAGNSGRIRLPIRKEFSPNAWVSVYLVKPGGERGLPKERFASAPILVRRPDLQLDLATSLTADAVRPGETVHGEVAVTSAGTPVASADLTLFAVDDAVLKLGDWRMPEIPPLFYPERPFGVLSFNALSHYVDSIRRENLTEKGFVIGDGGAEEFGNVSVSRKEFRTLAFWKTDVKTNLEGKAPFEFTAPDNLTSYRIVAIGQTAQHQFGGSADKTVQVSKPLLIQPALPRFLREGDEVELRAVVRQNSSDSENIITRCIVDSRLKLLDAQGPQIAQRDAPVVFRYKAKVIDPDLSSTKIRFEAVSKSNRDLFDSVENVVPVGSPVILRKESVAGAFDGPVFNPSEHMPDWKNSTGHYDLTLSTSPWLPKITGLPLLLDYPHGCFEQISTRLLGYSLLGSLLASLPDAQARDAHYREAIQNGLRQCDASLLPNGMLPYWSGEDQGNAFCTIQAYWAVTEAAKAGFDVPPRLLETLPKAVQSIATGTRPPFLRSFALMTLDGRGDFIKAAEAVYLERNKMTDEGRALLALALHRFDILPKEKLQLLSEITWPLPERAFDPGTFSSRERAEAICTLAFTTINPPGWARQKDRERKRISDLMESSAALSTQENLWLLLVFKALGGAAPAPKLQAAELLQAIVSRNGASASWRDQSFQDPFSIRGLNNAGSYILSAEFTDAKVETERSDRGFRVERVVRNLTEPKRTGQPDAPFKLGDSILITYRLETAKLQNYVALEDLLPAGLETVNPDLPSVAKFFETPNNSRDNILALSHSEMRDQSTLLYFNRVEPGFSAYSVLARATAAGTFRWPATQVTPMYDTRFSGLSPSSVCAVAGD